MRIVSLVPAITEALFLLEAGDSVVGVTDYCLAPSEPLRKVARVGGTKTPRISAILGLRPDLVILNTDENRKETFADLRLSGVSVLVTETDSLDQVETSWLALGRAVGREEAAGRERQRIAVAREQARRRCEGLPSLKTLILIWESPWIAAGAGTYMGALLDECGFENVLGAVDAKWVELKASVTQKSGGKRLVLELANLPAPEVVLLPTEPFPFSEKHVADAAAAFAARSVRVVDGELLGWWLSRTAEALDHFCELRRSLS